MKASAIGGKEDDDFAARAERNTATIYYKYQYLIIITEL